MQFWMVLRGCEGCEQLGHNCLPLKIGCGAGQLGLRLDLSKTQSEQETKIIIFCAVDARTMFCPTSASSTHAATCLWHSRTETALGRRHKNIARCLAPNNLISVPSFLGFFLPKATRNKKWKCATMKSFSLKFTLAGRSPKKPKENPGGFVPA